MKKTLITALTAAMLLGNGMTALAAPVRMPDGNIFDAEYYAANNPDISAALGADQNILYQHYVKFGMGEGRPGYDQTQVNENTPLPSAAPKETCKVLRNLPESLHYIQTRRLMDVIKMGKPTAIYWYNAETNNLTQWYSFEYDAAGNLITKNEHRRDGTITENSCIYEYDANGNLTAVHAYGWSPEYFSYDADGRLVSSRYDSWDGGTTTSYEYDANGNLTGAYSFDEEGALIWSYSFRFEYDAAGRLIKEIDRDPDLKSKYDSYISYEYDANGSLTGKYRRDRKNGTIGWANNNLIVWGDGRDRTMTTTYAYDSSGRLIGEYYPKGDGTMAGYTTYEYDANGNLIREYNEERTGYKRYVVYQYGSD